MYEWHGYKVHLRLGLRPGTTIIPNPCSTVGLPRSTSSGVIRKSHPGSSVGRATVLDKQCSGFESQTMANFPSIAKFSEIAFEFTL